MEWSRPSARGARGSRTAISSAASSGSEARRKGVSVTLASYGAVVFYLFPVVLVLWARATVDRKLSVLALDIPIAVAADLLLVLTLSRFMRLELATFVSR